MTIPSLIAYEALFRASGLSSIASGCAVTVAHNKNAPPEDAYRWGGVFTVANASIRSGSWDSEHSPGRYRG